MAKNPIQIYSKHKQKLKICFLQTFLGLNLKACFVKHMHRVENSYGKKD